MVPEQSADERFDRIDEILIGQDKKLDKILLCWEMRQATCPYRDYVTHNTTEIIRNEARLTQVETACAMVAESISALRLDMAKSGLWGGGVATVVVGVAVAVARALKWI